MDGVHAELISQVMQELSELYCEDRTSLAQQLLWMKILLERTSTITDLEKNRIKERISMFDQLLNESPLIQQIKKQAKEKANKEAEQKVEQELQRLQQETEQERLKMRRNFLVSTIRIHFPDLTDLAQQQVERFDQPAALDLLIQLVATTSDADAVRLALNAGTQ